MRGFWLVVAAVFMLVSAADCQTPPVSAQASARSAADSLVEGNTEFAVGLYRQIAGQEGNIVLSPLSVSIATAMLAAGAEGETEREINSAACFRLPRAALHRELARLMAELCGRVHGRSVLAFADGMWVDSKCSPTPAFKTLLYEQYDAAPEPADFGQAPAKVSARINDFVSKQTRGKIPSVVSPEMFTGLTRLVLVNTVYFLAAWTNQFPETGTTKEPFHLSSGTSVPVDMMHRRGTVRYCQADSVQVLEVPYQGSQISMLFILPPAGRDLAALEARLTPALVSDWVARLRRKSVDIAIPRFEAASRINLIPVLRAMGMKRAFEQGSAELPGLCSDPDVFISLASHHATLSVTEEGTEAAAATVYVATIGAEIERPDAVSFRADRPFMYIVRDMERGAIIFMGRVMDPAP